MKGVFLAAALFAASCAAALASGYSEFVIGLQLWRDQDDQAITHFTAAVADPTLLPDIRAVAYFDRGDIYMRRKQFDLAVQDFSASLALRTDFEAYLRRGLIYAAKGDTDRALADTTAAIGLRPNFPLGYHFRGEERVQVRDFKGALADADTMVHLSPDDMEGYEERSTAYRYLGQYSDAIDDAEHVVSKTNGTAIIAYIEEAAAYEEKGNLDRALSTLDDALTKQPKNAVVQLTRGVVLWEMKRYDEAERALLLSLSALPDDGYAVLWLYIVRADGHLPNADFPSFAARIDTKNWPAPVVRHYGGTMDMPAVLADAQADQFDAAGHVCEAHFYAAELQRIAGHPEAERPELLGLPDKCSPGIVEMRVAARILKETP
jgi:lipoprotein NlpI